MNRLQRLALTQPDITLTSIYDLQEPECTFFEKELYYLLQERTPYESISHKKMPTYEDHVKFVRSKPYKAWYALQNTVGQVVGAIYLSNDNCIGIGIFENCRRNNYATMAIKILMEVHKEEVYYANINPNNQKSIDLFTSLGFVFERDEGTQIVLSFRSN